LTWAHPPAIRPLIAGRVCWPGGPRRPAPRTRSGVPFW